MKIVMDFRKYDGVVGGVEQGVIQIVTHNALKGHHFVLLCKKRILSEVETLFTDVPNMTFTPLDVDHHSMTKENAYLDSTTIQDIAVKEEADLIHFPYNWSFPSQKKVPSILTIHDVIPFTFREAMRFFINHFRYKPGIKRACLLNDVITTVSDFSKNDIAEKVGVPLEKIRVILNGVNEPVERNREIESALIEKYDLHNGFIINVGGIHERKNIIRLIHAFAELVKTSRFPGKMIITGSVSGGAYKNKMKKLCNAAVREKGLGKKVIFTGFIPDEDLTALVRLAKFLVYPSLYEGFGIPLIEAMQLGTPVITSNSTALPEIGADAVLYINPCSTHDMASAMARVLSDENLAKELVEKGFKRARSFSWEKTAHEYFKLYQEVSTEYKI